MLGQITEVILFLKQQYLCAQPIGARDFRWKCAAPEHHPVSVTYAHKSLLNRFMAVLDSFNALFRPSGFLEKPTIRLLTRSPYLSCSLSRIMSVCNENNE